MFFLRSKYNFEMKCMTINPVNNEEYFEEKIRHVNYYGVNKSGSSIIGLAEVDLNKNKVMTDPNLMWSIPQNWSYVEAITIPYAYSMVIFKKSFKKYLF